MKKTTTLLALLLMAHWCLGQICFPITSLGNDAMYNRKLFSSYNMSYPIGFPLVLSNVSNLKKKSTGNSSYTEYRYRGLILYPVAYSFNGIAFRNNDLSFQTNNTLSIGIDNRTEYDYKYSRLATQSSGLSLFFISGTQKKRASYGIDGGAVQEVASLKRPLIVMGSLNYLWAVDHLTKVSNNGSDYQKQKTRLGEYTNRWQYSINVETGISYAWIRIGYSNSLFKDEYEVPSFMSKARISVGVNLLEFL